MAEALIIHSMERGNILEHFTSVGANSARNTTSPIAGSVDFAMIYPSGASVTFTTNSNHIAPSNRPANSRKSAFFFKFKFNNTPAAANADFGQFGTKILTLDTARKVKFDTVTGSTALSTGTVYCMEGIADRDWRMAGAGSLLVRVYNEAHDTLIDSFQVDISGTMSIEWVFGNLVLKSQTGPNVTIQIDNFVQWFSDSASQKAKWLNLQTPQTIRVPVAVGSHNDAVKVGSANSWENVDETSHNTTDFNNMGARGVQKRQTHTFTNVASYANTIRGWSFTNMLRGSPGQFSPGATKLIVRQSSTTYESVNSPSSAVGTTYNGSGFGMPTMPDLTSITAGGLNSLEFGEQYTMTDTNYNSGYQSAEFKPTADGATYDGNWTLTGGTAGSAYTTIDDGVTPNDADYLECNTINQKQGLVVTGSISPLTDIGDTVDNVTVKMRSRVNHNTSGSFIKCGVRISGTDYDADSIFLADPSTTNWGDDTHPMLWSGSRKNPATGNFFTLAEIQSYEWYFYITQLGTGPTQVSNFWLQVNCGANLVSTAAFLEVITGDAFTDNGNVLYVDRSTTINQSLNRSNTF